MAFLVYTTRMLKSISIILYIVFTVTIVSNVTPVTVKTYLPLPWTGRQIFKSVFYKKYKESSVRDLKIVSVTKKLEIKSTSPLIL